MKVQSAASGSLIAVLAGVDWKTRCLFIGFLLLL
jgi:hypothetical protein